MLNQLESYAKTKQERLDTVLKSGNLNLISKFQQVQLKFEYYYNLFYPLKNTPEFTRLENIHKIDYNNTLRSYIAVVKEIKELRNNNSQNNNSQNNNVILSNLSNLSNFEITNKTQALETKTHINTLNPNIEINKLAIKMVEGTNNQFSYGMYGDFKVLIMNKNGYINAKCIIAEALEYENKLREKRGDNLLKTKLFTHWRENKATGELYETLKAELRILNSALEEEFKVGKQELQFLRGTYIHPDLVNSLAMWVSPSYALIINRLINDINIKKASEKLNELIGEKDDKIDQLNKKLDELTQLNLKQSDDLKNLTQININQTNDIKQLLNYGRDTKHTINTIGNNLGVLYTKSIEPKKIEDSVVLILYDNQIGTVNNIVTKVTKFETTDKNQIEFITELYPFTFIRRQYKSINKSINKHLEKYPQAKELIRCNIANAILSLNNIKNDLNNKIKSKYNDFILQNNYTKDQFIIDITKIIYAGTTELKNIDILTQQYNY